MTELKHRIDVDNLDKLAAKTLALNEIGFANLAATAPVAFDPYAENRETGAFILIDRATNETAAAGMIAHGLRRATNIHRQGLAVTREAHAALKHQRPAILWFTGLSGAGKSTDRQSASRASCSRAASTPPCSTATTSATASTRISASPPPTGSRTSAASPKWRG